MNSFGKKMGRLALVALILSVALLVGCTPDAPYLSAMQPESRRLPTKNWKSQGLNWLSMSAIRMICLRCQQAAALLIRWKSMMVRSPFAMPLAAQLILITR